MKANRLSFAILILVLALTGACKLTLRHEIWLNDENSGEVWLTADAEYPKEPGEGPDLDMTEDSPFNEYLEYAEDFLEIEVLDNIIEDLSTEDTHHYVYTLKAEFGDFAELGAWLGIVDESGIEQEKDDDGVLLKIYPYKNEMLSMGRLEGELEDLSFMDIYSEYTIHTPRPIIYAKDADRISEDKKSATWEDMIDYDFYSEPGKIYELKY